jgi:NAD(P)-dependent dehydrogenase (short-subunit alcohol dehydrogenase family)
MKSAADHFRLDGRIALLTGAARGIGLGMAKSLAMAGCAVAIQDIDLPVAREEAKKINDKGGQAIALGGDVGDLSIPAHVVGEVIRELGGLHILVNNAAIQAQRHWLKDTAHDIQQQIQADLISPILFSQQVVPLFKKQRWGRIINLGSIQGRKGNPHMLPYSLCKAAIEKLTIALARDLADDQVTVNMIAPGWINTQRTEQAFSSLQDKAEQGKRAVPIGRVGEPSDFAGLILLLCSDAGEYITGQSIYVDGGLGAR